jgi:hypothetical protein
MEVEFTSPKGRVRFPQVLTGYVLREYLLGHGVFNAVQEAGNLAILRCLSPS